MDLFRFFRTPKPHLPMTVRRPPSHSHVRTVVPRLVNRTKKGILLTPRSSFNHPPNYRTSHTNYPNSLRPHKNRTLKIRTNLSTQTTVPYYKRSSINVPKRNENSYELNPRLSKIFANISNKVNMYSNNKYKSTLNSVKNAINKAYLEKYNSRINHIEVNPNSMNNTRISSKDRIKLLKKAKSLFREDNTILDDEGYYSFPEW